MLCSNAPSVKSSQLSKTPVSNTGSKCQDPKNVVITNVSDVLPQPLLDNLYGAPGSCLQFGVDYLTVTGSVSRQTDLVELADYVVSSFDDVLEWRPGKGVLCGRYYENTSLSARGIQLAWTLPEAKGFDPESDSKKIFFRLSIPGGALGVVDERSAWLVMLALRFRWHCRATRFDIFCDDYSKSYFRYEDVYACGAAGNYTGYLDFVPRPTFRAGKLVDWTLYFGSPSSDRRLRIYDKAAETDGKIDAYRMELQLRNEFALNAFASYCNLSDDNTPKAEDVYVTDPYGFKERVGGDQLFSPSQRFRLEAAPLLVSILIDRFAFIQRLPGVRAKRCKPTDWWEKFCSVLELVDVSHLRPERLGATFERSMEWFRKQVCPTAAIVRGVLGKSGYKQWWDGLLDEGERRWSARHKTVLEVALNDWAAAHPGTV